MNFRATSTFTGLNQSVALAAFAQASRLSAGQSAEIVLEEAEALVPVSSGDLRDSGHTDLQMIDGKATGFVIFDAPHAQFVEYGTGVRGIGSYPFDLPESGVPITGNWVYDYRGRNWKGMTAQPYARPALDTARPAILEVYRDNYQLACKLLGTR